MVQIERNPFGRLVLTLADGTVHEGVTPVRAFPLAAPTEGISLVGTNGREVLWIEQLDALPAASCQLIAQELANREFVPTIQRITAVSSFTTPCTWSVQTDRGATRFELRGEEDIRRLGQGTLLISTSQGITFRIADRWALDRPSRSLLGRFL